MRTLDEVLARIDAIERGVGGHDCRACKRARLVDAAWETFVFAMAFFAAFGLAISAVSAAALAIVIFVVGILLLAGQMLQAWPCLVVGVLLALVAWALFKGCAAIDRRLA